MQAHTVEIDGTAIHHLDIGPRDGEVLVLIHGLTATHRYWADNVAQLAKQAESHRRSLQEELKAILSGAALYAATPSLSMAEVRQLSEKLCGELVGRHQTDSVELLREDRSR